MTDLLGIVYAYHASPGLGELVASRTGASVPFCARYRAIDFALSGLMNAGVRDVGVVMQRDYNSLLDHLGSGRVWDLSRTGGGLRLLPPFGLPDAHTGRYSGCAEALCAVSSYISGVRDDYVLLQRGNLIANLDVADILRRHLDSQADITAVCHRTTPSGVHHRYVADGGGFAAKLLCRRVGDGPGIPALEVYIMRKELLLTLLGRSRALGHTRFHRQLISGFMEQGGRVGLYIHQGYAVHLETVEDYFAANMDMLRSENRRLLFPEDRPVHTKERADVGSYYGPDSRVKNCLVADGCYVEGELTNCVVFRGVRVERGARVSDSILMQDTVVGRNAELARAICDKNVSVPAGMALSGEGSPLVVPKGSRL